MFKIRIENSGAHRIFPRKIANKVAIKASFGLITLVSDPLHRSVSQKQVVAVPVEVQPLGCAAMQVLRKYEDFLKVTMIDSSASKEFQ